MKQQCASVWGRQAKADWLAQQQQKMQNRTGLNVGYDNVKCGRPLSLSQSAWPPLQVQPQNNNHRVQHNGSGSRAAVHGGSGARRGCGGTGVFLPRQYGNPPESRKKTSRHFLFSFSCFFLFCFLGVLLSLFLKRAMCFPSVRLCTCPASLKGCPCSELEDR